MRISQADDRPMVSVPDVGNCRDSEPPSQNAVRRGSLPIVARTSVVSSVRPSIRSVDSRSREDILSPSRAYPVGCMFGRSCTYLADERSPHVGHAPAQHEKQTALGEKSWTLRTSSVTARLLHRRDPC